jgi:hypothetical protein
MDQDLRGGHAGEQLTLEDDMNAQDQTVLRAFMRRLTMYVTRRRLLGTALASSVVPVAPGLTVRAQHATPAPGAIDGAGFGLARVRTWPSPDLAQAVFPDVMFRFLPQIAALPEYVGYIWAFDDADPRSTINVTLLADASAADEVNTVAEAYVEGMDPRLTLETPIAEQGEVRIYQLTDRPRSALPPFLHGCHITMRHRRNAPDTDIEGVIRSASEGFGPIVAAMDGFVLYCWMHAEGGRVSFNIWETADQLEAGNQAVADFVAANPVITSEGETVVHNGVIGYSDLVART